MGNQKRKSKKHRQYNDPETKTQTMAHKTCGNHRV